MKIETQIIVELFQGVVTSVEVFFNETDALIYLSENISADDLEEFTGGKTLTTVGQFTLWQEHNDQNPTPDQEYRWFTKTLNLTIESLN